MRNILIILALLLVPYWALIPAHVADATRGRIGIFLVFAFTGTGHFIKTEAMAEMLPSWMPRRFLVIYVSGVFEVLAAVAILIPARVRPAGIRLCAFLVLVLPANVYAAAKRVDFGGHAVGPRYLLIRIPLQVFLFGWIYWFTFR